MAGCGRSKTPWSTRDPDPDANPTQRVPVVTLALIAANISVFLLWQPSFGTEQEQQAFYFATPRSRGRYRTRRTSRMVGSRRRPRSTRTWARRRRRRAGAPAAGVPEQELVALGVRRDVPARRVVPPRRQHALPLDLRDNVEDRLGYVVYPLFYVLGGLAASALQLAIAPNSTIPSLGASGAIGGVLGAYIVLFPHARVTTLIIFFFITVIEVPAGVILAVWFVLQLFSGVGQLASQVSGGGVAYWAHVGGFAFGALVAWLFYRNPTGPQPTGFDLQRGPDPF